jgi:hypothetical protein
MLDRRRPRAAHHIRRYKSVADSPVASINS